MKKRKKMEWATPHSSQSKNPRKRLTENGAIAEDDLPRTVKSRKMTYRGLADSGFRQAGIDQAPVSHFLWFGGPESHLAKSEKWI
jgi:hypothetical protein